MIRIELKKDSESNLPRYTTYKNDKYCFRCGNKILEECTNCKEFGIADKNMGFYQGKKTKFVTKKSNLKELKLTSKQKEASMFIIKCYKDKKNCLINAVCGSGKTEITLNSIFHLLKKNKYVCFAITRSEILYDIYERFKYYFPETEIAIICSGENKKKDAQLYLMTTNQIMNYKNIFSLVIVDEVDAYPYEYNRKFDYGVRTSIAVDGIFVYLSATPNEKQKKMPTYVVNKIWHNYPLPIPILKKWNINNFIKKKYSIYLIFLLIKNKNKEIIIFVSTIKMGKKVISILKELKIKSRFVYASSANRKKDIKDFKNKIFNILLSTTILERGVTFKEIDVILLDADSSLYNVASLIQISGRVNRSCEYQKGKVIFLYQEINKNIKEALNIINYMNSK